MAKKKITEEEKKEIKTQEESYYMLEKTKNDCLERGNTAAAERVNSAMDDVVQAIRKIDPTWKPKERGHKKVEDRDETTAMMMDKFFDHAGNNQKIDIEKLRVAIETPKGGQKKTTDYAYHIKTTSKPKNDYAIKIGAFSNYDKALNHAKKVQGQFASKLSAQNIRIDKLKTGGKTLYRAQITGIQQADASKLCTALKNKGQDCVALKFQSETMYAEGSN